MFEHVVTFVYRLTGVIAIIVSSLICGDTIAQNATTNDVKSHSASGLNELREGAQVAMDRGDNDKGYKLARKALRLAPQDPQVVFLNALLLAKLNRFPEAIKLLDDHVKVDPRAEIPVLGQTADWMVQFGLWSDAESRYRLILEKLGDQALVHRKLAELFVRQGRRIEAANHLRTLCRLGDVTEAELEVLLMLAHPFQTDAADGPDPIGVLGHARFEISNGNWDAALKKLNSAKQQSDQELALLGRTLAHLQDHTALEKWSASIETPIENADYWFAMGSLHRHNGQHASAAECFCQAVVHDQTDQQAYFSIAQSLKEIDPPIKSDTVLARAKLIKKTQSLRSEMIKNPKRDLQKITMLIDSLVQLRRPLEALSWRGVRLAYQRANTSLTDTEAKKLFAAIMKDRATCLKANEVDASKEFILCDLNLDLFKTEKQKAGKSETQ